MYPGSERIYKKIADRLAEGTPPGWSQAWTTATVEEDHVKADYDFRNAHGEEHWFDPGFEIHGDIAAALMELRALMAASGQPAWSKVQFTLEKDGRFHIDFKYPES